MTPAQVFVIAGGHQRTQSAMMGGSRTERLPQGATPDPARDLADLARLTF